MQDAQVTAVLQVLASLSPTISASLSFRYDRSVAPGRCETFSLFPFLQRIFFPRSKAGVPGIVLNKMGNEAGVRFTHTSLRSP